MRGVETLVEDNTEPGVERVEHRDGRGVVIAARAPDVVGDQRKVEVPRLCRRRTRSDALDGAGREADRRETRWDAEAFLRAGVDRVDAPRVDLDRYAAERRDGVDDEQ